MLLISYLIDNKRSIYILYSDKCSLCFISLPWDQSTLLGYFLEQMFYIVMCIAYFSVIGSLLIPFMSICIHYRAFYQIVRHLIDQWNTCSTVEKHRSSNFSNDQKFLFDLIRFDVSFKRYVAKWNENYKIKFFEPFSWLTA